MQMEILKRIRIKTSIGRIASEYFFRLRSKSATPSVQKKVLLRTLETIIST